MHISDIRAEVDREPRAVHQMHVLVEVVDGKEVMRVDNIMADVPADGRARLVDQLVPLKRRLLILYGHGAATYSKRCILYSQRSALLFRRRTTAVKLVDRIVASV